MVEISALLTLCGTGTAIREVKAVADVINSHVKAFENRYCEEKVWYSHSDENNSGRRFSKFKIVLLVTMKTFMLRIAFFCVMAQ